MLDIVCYLNYAGHCELTDQIGCGNSPEWLIAAIREMRQERARRGFSRTYSEPSKNAGFSDVIEIRIERQSCA
jgi:hypothetical protein